MVRVSLLSEEEIVRQYREGVRINVIAKQAQVTRQAIFNTLKRTGAHEKDHGKVTLKCAFCGVVYVRFKSAKQGDYCSIPCYNADKDGVGYYSDRGTLARLELLNGKSIRKSRGEARRRINAETGEVVHHIDGNPFNNNPINLMTFKSHAEHMQYHHAIRKSKNKNENGHALNCSCMMCRPPKGM